MPKIKRNTHEIEIGKEEDIEIRGRRFRFYFQNRYTLISLAVDLLTGIFYIFGSLASLTKIPDRYGTYFYLAGAIFLTIRPILRIVRNIFIYDEKKAMKRTSKKKEAIFPKEKLGLHNVPNKSSVLRLLRSKSRSFHLYAEHILHLLYSSHNQ